MIKVGFFIGKGIKGVDINIKMRKKNFLKIVVKFCMMM